MMISKKLLLMFLSVLMLLTAEVSSADEVTGKYTDLDQKVKEIALKCRKEVIAQFNMLITSKTITIDQLFDTFYIPIPNTQPQKFQTAYDKITDEKLKNVLDKYLESDPRLIFVVAVDRNGYIPTHNAKFSKPLTDDPVYNAKHNRTKQIFNDRAGLAAAHNQKPFLLQSYNRDTGEKIYDLSVPVFLKDRHWGAIRVGYKQK